MSSEETSLQGFPNDDIFGVIAFALVQIKAVGLRYKRTITVERSIVGIQRSESSACVRSTLHQAIGRAKLRQDFLPVLDLRAYARLCGEIARASKVLSNKRTLVAFTYAPLEQLLVRSRAINLAWLLAILTLVSLRGTQCRGNLRGRLSQSGMGVPPYRHSERSVGIQRSKAKYSACVHSTLPPNKSSHGIAV